MEQVKVEDVARTVLEDRPEPFLDLMARVLSIPPEHVPRVRPRLEKMHDVLRQTFVNQLKEILRDKQPDLAWLTSDADHLVIAEVKQHLLDDLLQKRPMPVSPIPLTPELRQWVLGQDTEEEMVAGLREARDQNGPELQEVVRRLEEEWQGRERDNP